jgi:hypothetical protein
VLGTVLSGAALGAFNKPRPVTPSGSNASHQVQATDRDGDTTFAWLADGGVRLRVLRADGSRTPVRNVAAIRNGLSILRIAVDDDGDGVVVWDDIDQVATPLYARRVTRGGRLGNLRTVAPSTHDVRNAQVAVRPQGRAVITWNRLKDTSYSPWARTLGLDSHLGPAHQIGRGPNADAPAVDIDRSGRALLAWGNNGKIYVRRLSRSGALGPTVRVYRNLRADGFSPIHVAVDRDGDALVTWLLVRGTANEAWGRRVSRGMQPRGKARILSRRGQLAVQTEADMDLEGDAIVAWHVNYYAGVFARRIRRDGTVGPIKRLGDGGLGAYPVALDSDGDGAVAWVGYRNGLLKAIRVTRVHRDGTFGRTVTVGVNGGESTRITLDAAPAGRLTVAWEELPYEGAHILTVRGR